MNRLPTKTCKDTFAALTNVTAAQLNIRRDHHNAITNALGLSNKTCETVEKELVLPDRLTRRGEPHVQGDPLIERLADHQTTTRW